MDQSIVWWLVWTGIALVVAQFVFYYRVQRKLRALKKLPPGPKPRPVIGNLGELKTVNKYEQFPQWGREYGPIVNVTLGSVPLIVVSNSTLAKEVLKTKDKIFASRASCTVFRELGYDHNTISGSPLGPRWRTMRKIFVGELLTPKRVRDIQGVCRDEAIALLKVLVDNSQSGKPAPVGVSIRDHVGNTITSLVMNKRFFGPHAEEAMDSNSFHSMTHRILSLLRVVVLADYIPLFKLWDIQGYTKMMREVHVEMDAFLQAQIDNHRQMLKKGENKQNTARSGFLDVLLTRSGENDEYPMTDRNTKAFLLDTVLGGIESTASVIEWTLVELMKNPEKMKKAQEELDSVVGRDRLVEESDIKNLPYIDAAIKESLRLHPTFPILVPHVSTEDSELGGFHIPANSQVCVNVLAIGRDPEVWQNPLEFSPERFLGSLIDASGRHYELLPFGSGRRQCPGKNFAITMVQLYVATLLQSCLFTAPPDQTLDATEILRKGPIEAIVAPRLPRHVVNAAGVV